MLVENISFGVISLAMVVAATRVVTASNIVHAALYLVVVLAGAAGIFVLLAADFIAVVQILIYIGAILVLFLFGIMLTRAPIGRSNDLDNDQRWLAAAVAVFFAGVLGLTLYDGFGDTKIGDHLVGSTAEVGTSLFRDFVIPFEVASVLLLAALVGALVLARRD